MNYEFVCAFRSTTTIRTSRSAENPRRQFHCCAREGTNYGFVSWAEPPLCVRATEIIPGLLRSINNHEEKRHPSEKVEDCVRA
ncbi:hypothetical protein Hanom_Chr16g01438291 [Helianthus anomalus]